MQNISGMPMDQQTQQASIFGDDINSTPITKLQPMVQTKKDALPVEPPMYDPNPPAPPVPKRVRFEEPEQTRPRSKTKDPSYANMFHQQFAPPPPPPPPPKPRKIVQLFESYGTYMIVFVLVAIALWYAPKISTMPYLGTGHGLSILGTLALSTAVSTSFGIVSSVMD